MPNLADELFLSPDKSMQSVWLMMVFCEINIFIFLFSSGRLKWKKKLFYLLSSAKMPRRRAINEFEYINDILVCVYKYPPFEAREEFSIK